MFFKEKQENFFRPLTGKYREQVLCCLRLLYVRLYTSMADYGNQLSRQQILEVFQEAVEQAPCLEAENDVEHLQQFKSGRETAGFILTRLIEYGWLEHLLDEGSMQSAFRFSRYGRLFTQPMVDSDLSRYRTKHRNTRNTKNALIVFATHGEIHDLVDAWEFSERIISDFTDLIAELEDRKRDLVRNVEQQVLVAQASEKFFDYMDKRFQPDVAVRLSADSIEKHKDEIIDRINGIRRKRKEFKAEAEKRLRQTYPEWIDNPKMSLLYFLLDGIENRVRSASEKMLPEVRKALHSYTNRADIIIRQMTFLASQSQLQLGDVCKQLASLNEEEQSRRLGAAATYMQSWQLMLVDPGAIKLKEPPKRRVLNRRLETLEQMSQSSRKEAFIRDALEKAFMISESSVSTYLLEQLKNGQAVSVEALQINDVKDFLHTAHAIEAISARNQKSEFKIVVEWDLEDPQQLLYQKKKITRNNYFKAMDKYFIRCVES